MDKETEKNLSYSIIFDVPESGVEVNTFAEGMRDCLLALEEINNAIVGGIDTSIQVVSYIERLSAGSVQFDLKDDIKAKDGKADKAIEATFAGITSVYGDPTGMILITLKAAKDAIFKINDKRTNNKQKKEEIKSEITTILQSSNLNNDLKGYYLDDKRLNKAISHFAKGVKKTGDNVFYKSTNESEKLRINSSLADSIEGQDKKDEEAEEEKILQRTNTIEDIYTLLTPTSKEDCKWEFDDNGSKMKCAMEDTEFFNKYLNKQETLGGNENLKIKMKVETFLQGNKVKKEYTILKVIERIPDRNLFNYQDSNNKS